MKFLHLLLYIFICLSLFGPSVGPSVGPSESIITIYKEKKTICDTCMNKDGVLQINCLISFQCKCEEKVVDCSDLTLRNLPSNISFSKNTNIVVFKDNNILNVKDDTFYSGSDVIELDLSNNEIDFISIKAFLGFTNLQRLLLNHNQLYNLPPAIFDGLHKLRVLDLSHNMLKTLLPDVFVHLTELRELKLEANPLHEVEPMQFEHLNKLESLDLESTLLQNISEYTFSFTPKLKMLGLANNRLQEVPSRAFQALKNLKSLDLSGNPIKTIHSLAFRGMESLARLQLNRMPLLKYIQKYAFGDLKKLRELHCSYNYELSVIDKDAFITDEDGKKMALDVFTLSQNNLDTLSSDLITWSTSTELHVDGNAWSCDCRMKWMTFVKLKNHFQSQTRCTSPSELRDHLVMNLNESDFTCEISPSGMIFLICLSAVSIFILVVIVGCFVYRKNTISYEKPYFRVSKKSDVDEVVYDRNFKF